MTKTNSYLSFRLGEEIFALPVQKVRKILEMTEITTVPKSPDYMRGVINLRGNVLPVVDTRIKFGMSPLEKTKTTCILVIEAEIDGHNVRAGMLVDAVQSVLKIEENEILPPPSMGSKFRVDFITGMTKVNEKFFMILDIDLVLSSTDLLNIEDVKKARESAEENNREEENIQKTQTES